MKSQGVLWNGVFFFFLKGCHMTPLVKFSWCASTIWQTIGFLVCFLWQNHPSTMYKTANTMYKYRPGGRNLRNMDGGGDGEHTIGSVEALGRFWRECALFRGCELSLEIKTSAYWLVQRFVIQIVHRTLCCERGHRETLCTRHADLHTRRGSVGTPFFTKLFCERAIRNAMENQIHFLCNFEWFWESLCEDLAFKFWRNRILNLRWAYWT